MTSKQEQRGAERTAFVEIIISGGKCEARKIIAPASAEFYRQIAEWKLVETPLSLLTRGV
jgi:hypothetical protein